MVQKILNKIIRKMLKNKLKMIKLLNSKMIISKNDYEVNFIEYIF